MPRKDPRRIERGPKLTEAVCIGEEVKIGIQLAVQRFRLDPTQEELSFPSSLSTTERAYVHRTCSQLGSLKTWSRGSGQNRYITVRKVEGEKLDKRCRTLFSLAHSAAQVNALLNKYPVTAKEKQELSPKVERNSNTNENREKTNFGRLTNSLPQVPIKRGHSELNKFRENLPVYQMGATIVEGIVANKVVLVAGETGSGKTTQVPQLLIDDCHERKVPCRILCTQPRRIAAVSIAERVAAERGERVGHAVGYQIRLENKISPKTVLTFCTTGVLLRTLMGGDACLDNVTHVIVDEVHERDRFTDFLLLCLKQAVPDHANLRVILMSATLNMDLFSKYFDNCPVICVPGNLFPVEEFFLEDVLKWTGYKNKAMDKALLQKKKQEKEEEQLSEWCSKQLNIAGSVIGSGTEEDSDVTTSDNAELGEEKEDLEPWVTEEMDRLLREVWLTGNEELFHQILYLISSENVSVDYIQSETGTTPLMVAAARGFQNVAEHLLSLGADATFKTSNQWTALDFAKKFERSIIVELLEAHLSNFNTGLDKTEEDLQLISEENRELLKVYQQSFDDEKVDIDLVTSLICKIHATSGDGAILVFLPGYDDIVNLKTRLIEDNQFQQIRHVIYLLHSALQYSDQKKVFKNQPHGIRKIILSTNIAETSITINDVIVVVDCGKVKEKTYDALTSLTMLKSNWISKASALQRKGRAGRCQAGKCYHLFSRPRYVHLQDYQTPEILRLPLQELCLHTKLLAPSTQSIENFLQKCPQAPPKLVICTAVQKLKQIDALDSFEDLTELGQHLSELPIEPRLGKIVLYSVVLRCLDPVLTIVCTLAFKEPFVIPALPSERRSVMGKRRKFAEETYSDHMVFLRAFQSWQKARAEGWEKVFCEKNFISSSTMEMLLGMRMQLLSQLRVSGFLRARGSGDIRDLNTNSDNWALVKACLVAGSYPNVIQKDEMKMCLSTSSEPNVRFHSSSVLQPVASVTSMHPAKSFKKVVKSLPSKWLIYEEMSRFQRVALAKYLTLVSPTAMFLFGGHSKITQDSIVCTTQEETESDEEDFELDRDISGAAANKATDNVVKLDDWVSFAFDSPQSAKTAVQFRMKWHCLFMNRMRHPSRPWAQAEEAILQAICAVVTNSEKAIRLENPVGVGQRPRTVEPMMGAGCDDYYNRPGSSGGYQQLQPYHAQQQQHMYRNSQQKIFHGHGKLVSGSAGAKGGSNNSTPSDSPKSASPSLTAPGASGGVSSTKSEEDCRYFIMRCNNQKIVDISESKGMWAVSSSNEAKLNKAYQTDKKVYLIFSVPGNANFQGYARMTSGVTKNKSSDFPGSGLSGVFHVQWIKRAKLPFGYTNSLLNPWNENRRVHTSRDGQEIEPRIASELIKLWDTPQSRRAQSGGKKKPGSQFQQQHHKPQQHNKEQQSQQQQKQQQRKDKPSSSRSESSCASEDRNDNGKERGEVSQSSPSPALSTNTNNSSNSSASSPAHRQAQPDSTGIQFQGGLQPGMMPQTPAQISAQLGYGNTNTTKGYYPVGYQQQQGIFGQPSLNRAPAPGLNPLMLAQGSMMSQGLAVGHHPGLSPVMLLQRGQSGSVPQSQQQSPYYSGGQFNQHHN